MFDTVECPYCEHENEMDDDFSSNEFDTTCSNCEEEFEVTVEWDPSYSAIKIEYFNCEECGTETRDPAKRGSIFPWPKFLKKEIVCMTCFRKAHQIDYQKRNAEVTNE